MKKYYLFILSLFLVFQYLFGQSTISFSSTNLADGGSGAPGIYCWSNGYIWDAHCGYGISPASSYIESANLYFLGVNVSTGKTVNYPYGGGNFLTYGDGNSLDVVTFFRIWASSYSTNPIGFTGGTIYHEAGSDVTFTVTALDGSDNLMKSANVVIPTNSPTGFSFSGGYGFKYIHITPASSINFGINSFSFQENAFPVEWLDFSGKYSDGSIKLNWITAREEQNDFFKIERKGDSGEWVTIGNINSTGDTDKSSEYQFIDFTPNIGENYYRISQIDLNGTVSLYDRIVEVIAHKTVIDVYPNPGTDIFSLKGVAEGWTINVQNITGKILREMKISDFTVDLRSLPPGIYIFEIINTEGEKFYKKIIKN